MIETPASRVVQLRADSDRSSAGNEGTRMGSIWTREVSASVDHARLFNRHQSRLHQLVRRYARPGLVVFAMHPEAGLAGHLWLEADESLRAGSIGRHSQADIYLPHDATLSLRHLMVLTSRRSETTWFRVSDLSTPQGFKSETGEDVRGLEADGPLFFGAAGYSFLAVPTGVAPAWDKDASNPWTTLPRRSYVSEKRVTTGVPEREGVTSGSWVAGTCERKAGARQVSSSAA